MKDFANALLDAVVQTTLVGLILVQDARPVFATPAMARMVGWGVDEVIEQDDPLWFVHPEDRQRVAQYLSERLLAMNHETFVAARAVHRDGPIRAVHIRAEAIEFRGRRAHVVLVIDVSEHGEFLERLEQSERKYRGVVEQSDDGITLMDEQGVVIEWNRAQERITGRQRDEMIGRPVWEVMADHMPGAREDPAMMDAQRGQLETFLATGEGAWLNQLIEQEILRPDGTAAVIQTRYFAIPTAQGFMCANISRDVSERQRMEEQLRAHKSRLQLLASTLARAEEQERRRIATELHDQIGQALAAATMKLSALQDLPELAGAAEQLSEVHRLVSLAIEETRSLTFELAPPVLYELGLVAALEWLADQIQGQHGLLVEVVSDDLPKPLDQEIEVVVFRCVLELLNNVVKHAEAGAATVTITRQGGQVRVVVVDEGAGAPPRAEGGSRPPPSGFGLFNVRERIEQHGGQFSFESEAGRGTRVSLLVPIRTE